MRRGLWLLIAVLVSMPACDERRPQAKPSPRIPHVAPTYPDAKEQAALGDEEIPVYKMSAADTPGWDAFRSDVGGLPVPRGWKLIGRNTNRYVQRDGYVLDETYESPADITFDQALAWYLGWFPNGKSWGGWTFCQQIAGSGDAGWYRDIPENWAWRNPRNDHLIQIGLSGSPKEGPVRVSLFRSNFGEDCTE